MKGRKSLGIVGLILGVSMTISCASKNISSYLPFGEPCEGKAPIESDSERGLNEAKVVAGMDYFKLCQNNRDVDWGKIEFYKEGEFMYARERSNE